MKWLRAPNPVSVVIEVAIGVAIATSSSWARWFVTATLPLWSVVGGLCLAGCALILLRALWGSSNEKRARKKADRDLQRELLERLRDGDIDKHESVS